RESWPQLNESEEAKLTKLLVGLTKLDLPKAYNKLVELENSHQERRSWVWFELNKSPLVGALSYLVKLAANSQHTFGNYSLEELTAYYKDEGYEVDHYMRKSLQAVKTSKDRETVVEVIHLFYKPWLESITERFQKLIEVDPSVFTKQEA